MTFSELVNNNVSTGLQYVLYSISAYQGGKKNPKT